MKLFTLKKLIVYVSLFSVHTLHFAKDKPKVPSANSSNCRVSIDPGTEVEGTKLTEKTATDFLVACMLGGYKAIGTVDISVGMRALKPEQEKQLTDKGLKIQKLANDDIGIASNQQALNQLADAYKMPEGPARDAAIGRAMSFTIIKSKEEQKKEILLKKFCHVFCE